MAFNLILGIFIYEAQFDSLASFSHLALRLLYDPDAMRCTLTYPAD
jgi:hypothetical protein